MNFKWHKNKALYFNDVDDVYEVERMPIPLHTVQSLRKPRNPYFIRNYLTPTSSRVL